MNKPIDFFCDVSANLEERYYRTYHIKILNGEIVYAAKCKIYSDKPEACFRHDISCELTTKWELVKRFLQYFYIENRSDFYKIVKCLNLNTKSYKIAKEFIIEKHEEVLKEKEQLEKIIFF